MDYEEALNYLLGVTNYEQTAQYVYSPENFDLRRIEQLLKRMGNPDKFPKSVHIAGTKGKGSTAAMIASVLQTAGYKTGLFTSPHLHTFRERIQVNGKMISREELAEIVTEMYPYSEEVQTSAEYGQLTTFELATVVAFMYFAKQKVDFQVLEAGLGGRLDATNVVTPLVSVITSISMDHMAVLGDTLEAIAGEKAGIIKPGVTVVSAPQFPEATQVIANICQARGSRLIKVGRDITYFGRSADNGGQSFAVKTPRFEYDISLTLLGGYQQENAATAIAALEVIAEQSNKITKESIEKGIDHVNWPGRLQTLQTNPTVVVDGAHNPYSAMKLREALDNFFKFQNLYLVLGISYDKDIPGIIREISRGCSLAVVVRSKHPRAVDPKVLSTELAKYGVQSIEAPDVESAVSAALARADKNDLICVTGSLFVVSEAIEAYQSVDMD